MPERFLASVLPQHEAAELYRLMVIGIRDVAVFLMDRNGLITVWNRAAELMKGYSADEAIGQHLRMLYTDADCAAELPERNLCKAAEDGVYSEEHWRKCKDGRLFWARINLTALRSPSGELLGFSKVTVDLTRHKMLEQCEKEKREIDLILQAAESGTWKLTPDGRIEVSGHLRELLGYNGSSQIETVDDWISHVHADDRPALRRQLDAARAYPQAAPLETELRLLRSDGQSQWFFMRANWHYGEPEHPAQFFGVCVAIDGLKRAEQDTLGLLKELEQERARFSSVLDQLPTGVVLAELPGGKLIYQNAAVTEMLGAPLQALTWSNDYATHKFFDRHGAPIPSSELPLARRVRGEPGMPPTEELSCQRPDGKLVHIAVTTARVVDTDGVARIVVAVAHDITALKKAQLLVAAEKERALVTLAAIADGVITVDREGAITSMNPAAETLVGAENERSQGRHVCEVIDFEEDQAGQTLRSAIATCVAERRVIKNLPPLSIAHAHGASHAVEHALAPVPLCGGELIGAVLVLHDVTESKRLLRRLGYEASHDALTGLVNRREFEARLQRAIERARTPGSAVNAALLYLDLDQFKIVNDTCGHPAGDALLKQLAHAYTEHVRERDTLARLGGDEFALIVEHCDLDHALNVAHKILEATRNLRYVCSGRLFQLGVSIGATPIDARTAGAEDTMRRADHACYMAKERGRNRVYVHHHGDVDLAQRRTDMHWVTRLSHAFQYGQLQLYCQPIVALGPAATAAHHYEILLRLCDGAAEAIGPATFLPAAERYDVILKIDRWVLLHTLEWLAAHPEQTEQLQLCSINLSRRSLADHSFHKYAADLIDASAVPASKLCFEITEHGAIADMNATISFIEALSARGCRFSLDDFGTGMTSFSYLKQLPVDFIKIDGSLIQTMATSEVDYEMVRFTNDISHKMGRQTIAEYVSDPAILASLREIGVDYAQGYWVGKPRPLAM